ncbi:MAG: MauE/DoxX family redox-associated membrane protein [Actinomycetota bacterium]
MMAAATHVSALLLVLTFAWASLAKLVRWSRWRTALERYHLGPALTPLVLFGVPLVEAGVVALLLAGEVRLGAALVVSLISAFSLAVLRARSLEGDRLPCGCFGRASARDYRQMLLRNSLLGALAAIVLIVAGARLSVAAPQRGELVPAALVVAGLAFAGWLVWQAATALRRRA